MINLLNKLANELLDVELTPMMVEEVQIEVYGKKLNLVIECLPTGSLPRWSIAEFSLAVTDNGKYAHFYKITNVDSRKEMIIYATHRDDRPPVVDIETRSDIASLWCENELHTTPILGELPLGYFDELMQGFI